MKSEVEKVLGKNLEIDSLKTLHVHVFLSQGFLEFVNVENNCTFISSNLSWKLKISFHMNVNNKSRVAFASVEVRYFPITWPLFHVSQKAV